MFQSASRTESKTDDVALSEMAPNSSKQIFKCELLVSTTKPTEREIKFVVVEDSIILKHADNDQVLESWPFTHIRTWTIVRKFLWPDELIIDLTPYSDSPLTIASAQVLTMTASLRMAIAKRAKEIQDKIEPKPISFSYVGTQKFFEKIKKKVTLEISRIGLRILEDTSDKVVSIFSTVIIEKNLTEIKTCSPIGEDRILIDFGNLSDQLVILNDDPKKIVETLQNVVTQKSIGNYISESSSEDSDG
eukprot:TRINITY_DN15892_c0_g1_i1.p1 TRINITY_DN15892_c0_g1~~TRINITY_DN15892_c0_g1_i1.p1  ORF type:complete len:247 (-),score=33.71 TRINITY_DN15892_c0_g1_i1:47-787(-)